jgi:uncharacterized cupredoxin-like copper-binding protein
MKRFGMALAALALIGALAGCSSGSSHGEAQTIALKAESMAFSTKEMALEKGKTYKLVFNNQDTQLHDFSVDKIPAEMHASHSDAHDMGGKKPDLHVSAEAGKTGEVEFTPTKAGTYTFYCTVAGHKDVGMEGKIVVK